MKFFAKIKKYGIQIAAIIFCCCVALLFAMNISYKVTAEEASGTEIEIEDTHECIYFVSESDAAMDLGPINNALWPELMAELATVDDSTFAGMSIPVAAVLYLVEDISWDQVVYVPQNLHIGICLNGNKLDWEFETSKNGVSGVYVFDCSIMHTCDDATVGETMPALSQELADFLPYWAMAYGGLPEMEDFYVALSEDIDFSRNWTGALYNGALTICLNGHNVFNSERLTAYGGTLTLIDCKPDRPCSYFVADTEAGSRTRELGFLSPTDFDALVEYLNAFNEELTETYAVHCTLKASVFLKTPLIIPENVYLGVCLNGYSLNGSISVPESGNGGFYALSCVGEHNCDSLHASVSYLTQDVVDYMLVWVLHGGSFGAGLSGTAYALADDVVFGSAWQGLGAGVDLTICTCGYILDNQEILAANVTAINCAVDEVCRVCHPLGDMKNIPLHEVDLTQPGVFVNETLKQGASTLVIQKKVIDCFTPYVDENGVFVGDGSSKTTYLFSLKTDVKLAKTLVIPYGMDVHICLNGYQIESPKIIFYKEKESVVALFEVEYGGSLSIYDCSPEQTGSLFTNIDDSVAETEPGFDFSGLAVIFAYSIVNAGSFTLNGGSVVAMVGVVNAGDMVVNGGEIGGAFLGVVQGAVLNIDGLESFDDTPTLVLNGGAVTSAIAGLMATDGELEINDGTIRTLNTAIAVGVDFDGNAVEDCAADLTINGGTIEYGEAVASVFLQTGFLNALDIDISHLRDTMEVKDVVAIMVNGNVTINGDFEIVYSEMFLAAQERTAAEETAKLQEEADKNLAEGEESVPVEPVEYMCVDITLADGTTITVGESSSLRNQYTVLAENGAVISENALPGVFVGAGSFETVNNEAGELIIIDIENMVIPATVAGTTASTSGLIMLNFYVKLEESFVNHPEAKILIRHKGVVTEYTVADGKKSGSYYIFSVGVNAKDYKETVTCDFSMPIAVSENYTQTFTWHGYASSVDAYLTGLLESTNPAYDSAKKIAATMKDYCMAASVQFGVSTEYAYSAGIEEDLSQIKMEDLAKFEQKKSGGSERASIEGTTLFLESATTIRIYFTVYSGYSVNDLTCTINGKVVAATHYSGTLYYVEVKNIAASDLGTTHVINVDGEILSYSAISYVYGTITKKAGSTATLSTAKMLYLYYKAAVEYNNR